MLPEAPAPSEVPIGLSRPQMEVFKDPHRFRVLISGRQFGKSRLLVAECIRAALAKSGAEVRFIAPTRNQAIEYAWPPLKATVPYEFIESTNETMLAMRLVNGSQIRLLSADAPDSLRGPTLDFVAFDECRDIEPYAWETVIQPALGVRKGRAIFSSTPVGFDWVHDLYLRGLAHDKYPEWQSFQYTTIQGGWMPVMEIDRARAESDPRTFRQEYEATFETAEGRVYYQFARKAPREGNVDAGVRDFGPGAEILVGMDFNINPMAFVLAVKAGDECHVLDAVEMPVSNTNDVAVEIRKRFPARRIVVCPDPAGIQRRTSAPKGQTDITILKYHGFVVDAPSGPIPIPDRINNTNAMLCSSDGRRRLLIHPRAVPLIAALEKLTYAEHGNRPEKGGRGSHDYTHITDAVGYLLWQRFNLVRDRRFRVSSVIG